MNVPHGLRPRGDVRRALRFYGMVGAALTGIFLVSCNDATTSCVYPPGDFFTPVEIQVEALEDTIANPRSIVAFANFLSRQGALSELFFDRSAYGDSARFVNRMYDRFTHPAIDTLYTETRRVFGDLSELRGQLHQAFGHLKYHYPDARLPTVKTVITGLESDLYVSDTLVMIGLDYFIGPSATYRPNLYQYILRRYRKEFVVPSIFLLLGIDTRYNKSNRRDKTVLADMITYGKAYYFAKRMLPCVPDSVFIGYTAEEMAGAQKHSDLIWKRIIEDEVLYSTSHLVKQKYLAERPKTLEVGEKCPGRIAAWVGWQIVNAYMEKHPAATLSQLMQNANAQALFKQSKYRPTSGN